MESVVDETFDVHVTTVRKGLVHLITTARKGLMHLDTTCHVNVGCVCNVASGGGETGSPPSPPLPLPPPSPSSIPSAAMKTSEEEGLHLRPSSSHCRSALRQCFIVPYNVCRFISIEDVQLSMAAVRSLDLPFATRLVVFHLNENVSMPQPRSYRLSSECLAVCKSCERCLGGTHLQKLLVFRGDHWHRHRGRRRRGGQRWTCASRNLVLRACGSAFHSCAR